MKKEQSEFGRGLVICLVKFAEHFMELWGRLERQKNIMPESTIVWSWANGATDHLYDIKVPKEWKKTKIGKKVKELQTKGLEMGHGFGSMMKEKKWAKDHALELMNLTQEIALLIDKKLGIKDVDIGEW